MSAIKPRIPIMLARTTAGLAPTKRVKRIIEIIATIKLIRKCKIDSLILGRFFPIPGTPIYDELVKNGEIKSDFLPPSISTFVMPLGKKGLSETYTPKDLPNLNSFWLFLRETIYLAFRNPYSVLYFVKYYGFIRLIKKLLRA